MLCFYVKYRVLRFSSYLYTQNIIVMVDKTHQQSRISIITPARIKLAPPALALWGQRAPSRAAFPAVF